MRKKGSTKELVLAYPEHVRIYAEFPEHFGVIQPPAAHAPDVHSAVVMHEHLVGLGRQQVAALSVPARITDHGFAGLAKLAHRSGDVLQFGEAAAGQAVDVHQHARDPVVPGGVPERPHHVPYQRLGRRIVVHAQQFQIKLSGAEFMHQHARWIQEQNGAVLDVHGRLAGSQRRQHQNEHENHQDQVDDLPKTVDTRPDSTKYLPEHELLLLRIAAPSVPDASRQKGRRR